MYLPFVLTASGEARARVSAQDIAWVILHLIQEGTAAASSWGAMLICFASTNAHLLCCLSFLCCALALGISWRTKGNVDKDVIVNTVGDDRPETNEDAENNGIPAKICSACEKKGDTAKLCNWCKCVWYCDGNCQNKHHLEHEHECKRIKKKLDRRGGKLDLGKELDVGPLGKLPPQEECPICMLVFPIHPSLRMYNACCGKTICSGCDYQQQMKNGEQADACAFCRTTLPESDEEVLAQLRKRVELKDPKALLNMALYYGGGELGLPRDQTKCIELLRESAGLGFPHAQYQLGIYHYYGEMGLEQNKEEALKYFKKATEGDHLAARRYLGSSERISGNYVAAMRHWRLSAAGGYKPSMNCLIFYFECGFLHHADLAVTLRAFYRARAEMKSKDRDQHIEYLKQTGEYREEYDT